MEMETDQMETERKMEMDLEMETETDLEGAEEGRERRIETCVCACRAPFLLNVYMQNLFLHSHVNAEGAAPAHQSLRE